MKDTFFAIALRVEVQDRLTSDKESLVKGKDLGWTPGVVPRRDRREGAGWRM